jgi:Glyoxalase-like domain
VWAPSVAELAGAARKLDAGIEVNPTIARFTMAGDRGQAVVTVRFTADGGLDGFGVDVGVVQGISNVVIACPPDRRSDVAAVYASLLGEDRWRVPRLVFGEGRRHRAPAWPDPERPQQLHLDVRVPDLDEAGAVVVARGARLLQDSGSFRIYEDPVGHPFCIYSGADGGSGALWRIVIDCFSPRNLAAFYRAVLGMPNVIEDSVERVVLAGHARGGPLLAFQHAPIYVAPRWPDPAFPQQIHLDLKFDDRVTVQDLAERHGAVPLPPQGGSCPVYADPAGHPFCLGLPAE